MTDRAAVFCALLTAMGVAAPSVTHAADVQADVTKVRDVRAKDKSFDNDRALMEATTFKFDNENLWFSTPTVMPTAKQTAVT